MKAKPKNRNTKNKKHELKKKFLGLAIPYLNSIPWEDINFPDFPRDIGLLVNGSTKESVPQVVYLIVLVSVEVLKLHQLTCKQNKSENLKEFNDLIDVGNGIINEYKIFG
jgi:hypothetical protein